MPNIYLTTLGCQKNDVDSQVMLSLLSQDGAVAVSDPFQADVIIVNTCGFIEDAKEESIREILAMAKYKTAMPSARLIVTGCLAQRYHQQLREEIPEVDVFVGTTGFEKIQQIVRDLQTGNAQDTVLGVDQALDPFASRYLPQGTYSAPLKIAEGCDKHCTYCVIPALRGPYRSRPIQAILAEAKQLAAQGIVEIDLIAQDTSLYGKDLYGEPRLAELLNELAKVQGLRWIRLLYLYPEDLTEEIVLAVKAHRVLCRYFDIPVQHGSNRVLKAMNRHTTAEQILQKIQMIRRHLPDAAIRTTLIAGFPGESEQDLQDTLAFMEQAQFDRLGVFTYSREEDTAADQLPDHLPEEVKQARRARLMQAQQQISLQKNQQKVGQTLQVLIEEKSEEGLYVGRSEFDAAQIDGLVFVHTPRELLPGTFVKVRIDSALEYDLVGNAL